MALPNTDTAGTWNKSAYQGDTFVWEFDVEEGAEGFETPVDLSSAVVTMTIKKVRGATVADLWTGSTTDGAIVIGGVGNNAVNITIPATDMADIPAGSWQYDIQFVEGGVVHTYLTGAFTVTAEVTP
jgi:hypothetical protein